MEIRWAFALIVGFLVAAVATPLCRRYALRVEMMDVPDQRRKVHKASTPYLGGVAIMLAAVAGSGVPISREYIAKAGLLAVCAVLLGIIGLVDDRRNLHPFPRFAAQSAAAAIAVLAGVEVTVIPDATLLNAIVTVVWIVGITNAVNLLDNMDGLAAGTVAISSAGVFALAALGDQYLVAGAAAAITGACLGFLVYNRRPASIFMGDAGSLFLGFSIAVLTAQVNASEISRPQSWVVPALLLGLAVTDTSLVTVERLRRGRSPFQGGQDHLSHRLAKLGLGQGWAVVALLGFQAVLAAAAVAVGRGVINPLATLAVAAVAAGALVVVALRHDPYPAMLEAEARLRASARRAEDRAPSEPAPIERRKRPRLLARPGADRA